MLKLRGMCAAVVGLAILAGTGSKALPAEIKSLSGKDGRVLLLITGEIVPGDSDTFVAAVKQANAAGKLVPNVRLNSDGGNLLEGVKLADAVRFGKISTNVGKNARCASACFLVFAAGQTKYASYGAQIGVHGASDQSGAETVSSEAATVSMAKIAKDLGVPPAIIGRMVVTPPSEMVWLTPQDLQSMGVTMVGKPAQTAQTGPMADLQQTPSSGAPTSILPPGTYATIPQTGGPPGVTGRPPGVMAWEQMVDLAMQRSSSQNNGKPLLTRFCQPEERICIIGLTFINNEGRVSFLKTVENANGKIIAREACTLNEFKDVRTCLDWDSGSSRRDMQNSKGDWIKVSDE